MLCLAFLVTKTDAAATQIKLRRGKKGDKTNIYLLVPELQKVWTLFQTGVVSFCTGNHSTQTLYCSSPVNDKAELGPVLN
jgi:hypothetical protein